MCSLPTPHVYYLAVHANMNTGMDYQPPSAQMLQNNYIHNPTL